MKKHAYIMLIIAIVALASLTGCLLDHENIAAKNNPLTLDTVSSSVPVETLSTEPKNAAEQLVTLTLAEARAIALSHLNVNESKIRDYEVDLEREGGVTFYEISFEAEGWEYDYEIDAYTGEVLRREVERDR